MKSTRTKYQELVAEYWGYGVYLVGEEDLPKLAQFFEQGFGRVLSHQYLTAMKKFLAGQQLAAYERQLKFYATNTLRTAFDRTTPPDFLKRVSYPEGKRWALADVAEVLFGQRGDTRIYRVDDLPEAGDGHYSTAEVKEIVAQWNQKQHLQLSPSPP